MATKAWYHQEHGDKLHDLVRFLVERYIVDKGGKLRDTKVFKARKSPCEPDVYFEWDDVLVQGNHRVHRKMLGVVEVETNATSASLATKQMQYEETMAGVRLIVIDLGYAVRLKTNLNDWRHLEEFIQERMPL